MFASVVVMSVRENIDEGALLLASNFYLFLHNLCSLHLQYRNV